MFTVKVKLHVAVLPELSVFVQVTVVVPCGNVDPDAGVQTVVAPGQLSEAVGAGKVPVALVVSAAPVTVWFAGHVIVGGWVSLTVTVNVQLVGPSVAEQVTVVVPTGKNEPDAGEHVTVPQLPLVVGAA